MAQLCLESALVNQYTGPRMATDTFQFRLDLRSGVPAYRQVIDQILGAITTGKLKPGDRLPTVRQLAVDLAINPNTVVRAYKELEIRGVLATQQGIGTFISTEQVTPDEMERQRRLTQLASEFVARAAAEGFTVADLAAAILELKE